MVDQKPDRKTVVKYRFTKGHVLHLETVLSPGPTLPSQDINQVMYNAGIQYVLDYIKRHAD